jgi:hypothetical protein
MIKEARKEEERKDELARERKREKRQRQRDREDRQRHGQQMMMLMMMMNRGSSTGADINPVTPMFSMFTSPSGNKYDSDSSSDF